MSRRFLWRIFLLGSLVAIVAGLLIAGRRHFPIPAAILFLVAVRVVHPVMDRDVPLLAPDLAKSPRLLFGLVLLGFAALFLSGQQDMLRRLL
jgi:hypothetical protein